MRTIPKPALWLGLAGLIPFLVGAAISLSGEPDVPDGAYPLTAPRDGLSILASYGVIILSFMSGVLWGFAVRAEKNQLALYLTLSVLPALYCFFFVGSGPVDEQLFNLTLGFIAILALDYLYYRRGLTPDWWMNLRSVLTAIVVTCLILGGLA